MAQPLGAGLPSMEQQPGAGLPEGADQERLYPTMFELAKMHTQPPLPEDLQQRPYYQLLSIPIREPRPANLTQSFLPTDLLAMIVDMAEDCFPRYLPNIAQVCTFLSSLARHSLHRTTVIRTYAQDTLLRLAYMEDLSLLSDIRRLVIYGAIGNEVRTAICNAIPKMKNLRTIDITYATMPREISEVLKQLPHVGLRYSSLLPNPNIISLCSNRGYSSESSCRETLSRIKEGLLSCPGLRSLCLDIGPYYGDREARYAIPEPFRLFNNFASQLPVLEELWLPNYPFFREQLGAGAATNTHNDRRKAPEEEHWAKTLDWSHLRRLHTGEHEFALAVMPRLTALKDFSLIQSSLHLSIFLECVPSNLWSITIPNLLKPALPGLARHGPTLRRLYIHQAHDYAIKWSEIALTAGSLQSIRQACPHLEELGIDLFRRDDWPYDALDVIASFPCLQILTLWLELSKWNVIHPIEPYVTVFSAKMLFRYVREQAPPTLSDIPRLQKLDVHVGKIAKFGVYNQGSWTSHETGWFDSESNSLSVSVPDRDDDAAAGKAYLDGRGLTRQECDYLTNVEELDAGVRQWMRSEKLSDKLRSAVEGPMAFVEWRRRREVWEIEHFGRTLPQPPHGN